MKMKALVAIVVAGIMVMSVPMVALAETISESGTYNRNIDGDSACAVKVETAGENIVINGDTKNNSASCCTAYVDAKSEVTVNGNVNNEGDYEAINASGEATVNAYNVANNSKDKTVSANNATVTVTGAVTNNGEGYAIYADNSAKVTAGSATNTSDSEATVEAIGITTTDPTKQTKVEVKGAVTNNGEGEAINAKDGAIVVVESVKQLGTGGDADAISADGNGTIVVVYGNVDTRQAGACAKNNATVVVEGTITGDLVGAGTINNGTVLAYEVKTGDTGTLTSGNVHYIIKTLGSTDAIQLQSGYETSEEILGKTYNYADASDTIVFSVKEGYNLNAPLATKNADGTYTIIVPTGGGVTLEAIVKAVQSSVGASFSFNPTILGSEEEPITGGTWAINNGSWTYKYNGANLVNTLAWIKTEKPDGTSMTNRYYFDKSGNMATGWQKTGDNWFYFNPGSGEMLTGNIVENGKIYHIDKERGWDRTKDVSGAYWTLDGKLIKEEEKEEKYWYI